MDLYILYSRFTDDPSIVYGIFDNEEDLMRAYHECKNNGKDWRVITADQLLEEPVVLD